MDLIIYNGDIRTMDKNFPRVQAVGIKDGLVKCIGSDVEVLSQKTKETRLIDIKGRCVVPGFNDSHLHLLGYAATKSGVDLLGAQSVDDVVELIKRFIEEKKVPDGVPVWGRGWNNNLFPDKEFPTKLDLDRASDKHPIYAARVCGHAASVNTAMLVMAGVNENTAIDGGEILRYEDGSLNGVLTETALDLVKANDKALDVGQIKELLKSVAPELARVGITSVQTDDFSALFTPENVCEAYASMAGEGKLTFRVYQQCKSETTDKFEKVMKLPEPAKDILPMFRLGPIKFFADGSLGARTALMLDDYQDMPGVKGVPIYNQDALDELVEQIHTNGWDVAIHAIGDGAIDMSLNSIEKAQKKHPRPEARHGIVHAQITTPEIIKRLKRLNVMAYIQPIFIDADGPIATLRVGKEKASTSYAWKTLQDEGIKIPAGTDCPVESFDPFDNIYCAVTRKGLAGESEGVFNPEEALTVDEVVRAYTVDSAYASYEEDVKGKLMPGYYADLVVLSRNIFTEPHENIRGTESVMTVMGGRIVYEG